MSLKGFGGDNAFTNSKIATSKVISDTPGNAESMVKWGNSSKVNVGLASNSKAAHNATTLPGPTYGEPITRAGGASGDGPTPGYSGSGCGVDTLSGAQGNISKRKAY